jgi:menaquinone-dependent protoporphyrinogen IX oxidase
MLELKTLIVCASRYGSTLEIGRWIGERLPWTETDCFAIANAPSPADYDLVIYRLEGAH